MQMVCVWRRGGGGVGVGWQSHYIFPNTTHWENQSCMQWAVHVLKAIFILSVDLMTFVLP